MGKDKKEEKIDILENEEIDDSKKESKNNDKEIKSLKEEIEKLKNDNQNLNNEYLKALAEQRNYKKRLDDEMDRFYKYSTFDMCKEFISILDSFDLAIEKEKREEMKAYLEGFKLTRNQIMKVLEKQGVTEINALGLEFDPNTMVSLSHTEDKTKKDQEVVNVFMKGYMYKDRVLRPANVIINMIEEEEIATPQEENKNE